MLKGLEGIESLDLYECPVTRVSGYRGKVFGAVLSLKFLDKVDKEGNERPESDEDEEDDLQGEEEEGEEEADDDEEGEEADGELVDGEEDDEDGDENEVRFNVNMETLIYQLNFCST